MDRLQQNFLPPHCLRFRSHFVAFSTGMPSTAPAGRQYVGRHGTDLHGGDGPMSVAQIFSRAQVGLEAPLVEVELHVGRGLPNFSIVGLPAPVVRESRERVRAALVNSGFDFPVSRITVNLAPVELHKQGGRFDLPIALGLLMASGQLRAPPGALECYGELGLDGELRPVNGMLLAAMNARRAGHALIVPDANAAEVSLSGHPGAQGAATLREAVDQVRAAGTRSPAPLRPIAPSEGPSRCDDGMTATRDAFADVVGQLEARRALLIAAAGGHSVLMVGPPGSGKSLLASRLPALLPPLNHDEALEVASIASVAGQKFDLARWFQAPFRAPHHTASAAAIVGGGALLRPGEISLAHRGVLFMDELPEYDRRVLESLREPLESGAITLSRAASRIELPAQFQLIAAMNPCPCGYQGDDRQPCQCTPARVRQYRQRISGPLLDRIDIRIRVSRVRARDWMNGGGERPAGTIESEGELASQVQAARQRRQRCSGSLSARLPVGELQRCCALPDDARTLLHRCCEQLNFSGRGIHRLLAVARTIADLAGIEQIARDHLAEAIQLRRYCASDTM
jgi:magnesium chelatase family protein